MKTAKTIVTISVTMALFGFFSISEAGQVKKKTASKPKQITIQTISVETVPVSEQKTKKKRIRVRKKKKLVKKSEKRSTNHQKNGKRQIKLVEALPQTIGPNRVDPVNNTSTKNPIKEVKLKGRKRIATRHIASATMGFGKLRARNKSLARFRSARERFRFSGGRLGASPKTFGPDLLDDPRTNPRMEWIKHQFTRQMEMDRFIRHPYQDMIDWGRTGPGPDREPPSNHEERHEHDIDQRASSTHCQVDSFTRGELNKVNNWGSDVDHPLSNEVRERDCNSNNEEAVRVDFDDTDDDSDDGEEATGDEEFDMVFTEEEAGIEPENTNDSDPEGDDPDEFHSPVNMIVFEASVMLNSEAMMGNNSTNNQNPQNGNGDPVIKRSVDEGGEGTGGGLRRLAREHTTGSPIPEDGQPDEYGSPAASGAISHTMAGGYNYQPEPGGEDPGDPRASDGGVSTIGLMGYAASPADGGQGGEPFPPGPEY